MAIFITADAQVAHLWDHLETVLSGHPIINPNKNLEQVVQSMEEEDIFISNGDTVDYHYATYEGEGNNWDIFRRIIGDREHHLTRGNHDFRLYPYNLGIYGLNHVNVPDKLRKKFAKEIGNKEFRWFSELSLSVFNKVLPPDSGLAGFPPYYHKDIEDVRHIFLNTGPDAVNYKRMLPKLFIWRKVIADSPCVRGLGDEQVAYLKHNLSDNSFVYVHAPPFFSMEDGELDLNDRKRYLRMRRKFKLGIFIDSNWEFVDTLMQHEGNITVFTSHTEVSRQYIVDKETGLVTLSSLDEVNERLDDAQYIKFVSTPPLGCINKHCQKIGYLRFDRELEYVDVGDYS